MPVFFCPKVTLHRHVINIAAEYLLSLEDHRSTDVQKIESLCLYMTTHKSITKSRFEHNEQFHLQHYYWYRQLYTITKNHQ
jgi:galactose mutarotase-like enzyme